MVRMRLNDCIDRFDPTGACGINRKIALKYFTDRCFISEYHKEYRLVRVTHKRHFSMKVTIEPEDAKYLIKKLDLVKHSSGTFNYGSTYLMKGVSPNKI
jgi:hypothetical protein